VVSGWATSASIEKAEVIVYLGYGPHGGAWVVRDALLVNGDGRGKTLYILNVRLLHTTKKLPCVGGQRLHIATLPLSIDGVEGQGTFTGARYAGDDHQFVTWDDDIHVLEIVLSGSLDDYVFLRHCTLYAP
jgi:hypothetical protein